MTTRKITHEDMAKLISVYLKGQENINAEVTIYSGEDGYFSANFVEIDGIKKSGLRRIKKEDFEKIIYKIYEMAGQQVTDIVNYGAVGSTVNEKGFTKIVTPELANHISVTTEERQKVLSK